ncbi:MAG: hypothetical protein ACPGVO_16605 [Spirulinaceae cyanobacterium]
MYKTLFPTLTGLLILVWIAPVCAQQLPKPEKTISAPLPIAPDFPKLSDRWQVNVQTGPEVGDNIAFAEQFRRVVACLIRLLELSNDTP